MVRGIIGSHVTLMGLKLLQKLDDFPVVENDHVARFSFRNHPYQFKTICIINKFISKSLHFTESSDSRPRRVYAMDLGPCGGLLKSSGAWCGLAAVVRDVKAAIGGLAV